MPSEAVGSAGQVMKVVATLAAVSSSALLSISSSVTKRTTPSSATAEDANSDSPVKLGHTPFGYEDAE